MHLLWIVGLSDPLWLSDPGFRKLPDKKLQLCQPLPVPGVSYVGERLCDPDAQTGPGVRS